MEATTNMCEPSVERPTLIVHANLEGRARLLVPLSSGQQIEVRLAQRFARLLYVLIKAWDAQAHIDLEDRGYLTQATIVKQLAQLPNAGPPVQEETINQMVYLTRRAIDDAVADVTGRAQRHVSIQTEPTIGYRVPPPGMHLRVIDACAAVDA